MYLTVLDVHFNINIQLLQVDLFYEKFYRQTIDYKL